MTKETLERLLNEACELLIVFEDSNASTSEDKLRIAAIFDEIKYSDRLELDEAMSADDEAQDWNTFNKEKI
jgi:hypothetical protein